MTMALEGVKVLDLSRTPPGQYATMFLADFGADVLMIEVPPGAVARFDVKDHADDPAAARLVAHNALRRNKRAAAINLREPDGLALFRRLIEGADVVVDGFRPGVTTRLGIDYEALSAINPRVITCSVAGYGRTGPYHAMGGHDINYISIGGVLGAIGDAEGRPVIPMNLVADYAAGGLMAAVGVLLALQARERTGRGQDIDHAMSDGVTSLMAQYLSAMLGVDGGPPPRGVHPLSGGRAHYHVYECADGEWVSVGAIEPYFFEALCNGLGLPQYVEHQNDEARQDEIRRAFAAKFKERTRDEWFAALRDVDACLTPVLSLDEVVADPHVRERGLTVEFEDARVGRVTQVGIAPRLLGTPGAVRRPSAAFGEHTDEVLAELGHDAAQVASLRERGVVA